MKLISIGFGNAVAAGRILAVVSPDSAPIKRVVQEARERGCCSTRRSAAGRNPFC